MTEKSPAPNTKLRLLAAVCVCVLIAQIVLLASSRSSLLIFGSMLLVASVLVVIASRLMPGHWPRTTDPFLRLLLDAMAVVMVGLQLVLFLILFYPYTSWWSRVTLLSPLVVLLVFAAAWLVRGFRQPPKPITRNEVFWRAATTLAGVVLFILGVSLGVRALVVGGALLPVLPWLLLDEDGRVQVSLRRMFLILTLVIAAVASVTRFEHLVYQDRLRVHYIYRDKLEGDRPKMVPTAYDVFRNYLNQEAAELGVPPIDEEPKKD